MEQCETEEHLRASRTRESLTDGKQLLVLQSLAHESVKHRSNGTETTHRLFVYPFLFPASTLYKPLMKNLEVYGRSTERGEA